uniref:CSON002587 protein n=1 Tax=Culicoides sonorensis TaxID=179676 RepID=A0A336K620_CULSO
MGWGTENTLFQRKNQKFAERMVSSRSIS